ncbi:MAG: pyruvate kinase [Eubacteriales bacterium]|nr:pyruvate kinase [Eubacteriales bacterium]MDY3332528.1 pyruvate kinase [Gallibacter sp.]
MRKTKIICTIGPAVDKPEMIEGLIEAGMNVARLNFSHGTHEEQLDKIKKIKQAREKLNAPVAILLDTKGPEIRTKDLDGGVVVLEEGDKFTLVLGDELGNKNQVAITYEDLYKEVHVGDTILLDDGKIRLEVEEIEDTDIRCVVVRGDKLGNKKGVNIPGISLEMEYMSEKDKSDIAFGIKNEIDFIAASFVRRKQDIKDLKEFLRSNGGNDIKIIAKLENEEGVENFKDILDEADGVMVARGDMGVEIEFERLPGIQKRMIAECRKYGKIAITATQMLDSMTEAAFPTRAEITDVANAVFDGTSAVMLSGETATGKYPVETVSVMDKILIQAEEDQAKQDLTKSVSLYNRFDIADAVGHAACQAAEDLNAKAIVAVTISGYTSEKMAKYRPSMPVVSATPNKRAYYQQGLVYGVYPILTIYTDNWIELLNESFLSIKREGFAESGDTVVITAGMPLLESGKTNLMRVEQIG